MPPNRTNQPNQLKHKAINSQKALPYIIHFVLCPIPPMQNKTQKHKSIYRHFPLSSALKSEKKARYSAKV